MEVGTNKKLDIDKFIEASINKTKTLVNKTKVICALSGGVDSSVAAVLVHKAIGKQLNCIFVDNGLMRKGEGDEVEQIFKKLLDMNLIRINAQDRFIDKLTGVNDPEKKRKIIGEEFIRVFEEEAKKLEQVAFLVQGTIYSDVVESGGDSARLVKSHHNVGGLPQNMNLKLIEPLRSLYKEEVRKVGLRLGIPEDLVFRQPFPGPGLGVRVLGEITKEKLDIIREADAILQEEINKANLQKSIWQYFTVLPDIKSVGIYKGERTYNHTIAIRAVNSINAITAKWTRISYDILERISDRIVKEVPHVNRVVYDITNKPPSTIEWE